MMRRLQSGYPGMYIKVLGFNKDNTMRVKVLVSYYGCSGLQLKRGQNLTLPTRHLERDVNQELAMAKLYVRGLELKKCPSQRKIDKILEVL